jgi:putative spermidine/putrescine transport system substrate-binding protein
LFARVIVAAITVAAIVGGCGLSDSTPAPLPTPSPSVEVVTSGASAQQLEGSLDALIEAAQGEGSVTVMGLAQSRCGFSDIVDAFEATYSLTVNELDPNGSVADHLKAIKDANGGGADGPDVVDLPVAAADEAAHLDQLAPYRVSTWDSIPNRFRHPDGDWTGAYYGVLSFEVNASRVRVAPTTWANLLDPEYANMVALAGDPRASGPGSLAVYAAALANGGSLGDAQKGLEFFKRLDLAGNLVTQVATAETIDDGRTPVAIRLTYDSLKPRDGTAGDPDIEVTVPASGRLAVANAQAILVSAPHPNAARLWMEFLYSDVGQNLLLDGYCHPVRFDDLSARGVIPVETLAKLPETSPVDVPTVAQLVKATDLIAANWDRAVGVDIR